MTKLKNVYEVFIHTEYSKSEIYDLRDKYTMWFKTKKAAIEYARSIKKELKEICKKIAGKNDVFCLDVNHYTTDVEILDEQFEGVVYSLNLVGKY